MHYLGVDGGGTKTAFLLINQKGEILSYLTTETCHYIQVGMDNFKKVIKKGIKESCINAGIDLSEINYTFFGIPGFGENDKDTVIIRKHLSDIMSESKFKCGNDVEAGWAGSLACQPGINVVAGTGAIGFAKDQKHNSARASGWGYFCGDEGSAYWLGKKVISLFTKEADKRLEKTEIYNIVKEKFDLKRDFDLIEILYNDLELKRNKIASLAKLLYKAAQAGDKKAVKLYKQAAYEHSLIVKALIKKLNFTRAKKIPVSYSGGVFKAGYFILEPLKEYIKEENVKLIEPILKPVTGAALYAKMLANNLEKPDRKTIDKLKKEEKRIGV